MNQLVMLEREVYQLMIQRGIKEKEADKRIQKMSIDEMVKYLKDSEN